MTPKKFSVVLLGGFPWKRLAIPQEALPFGDGTVLDRCVAAYRGADARAIVLAMGPAEPVLDLALEPHREQAQIVRVNDPKAGVQAYLQAGLEILDEQGGAIAVGLADMPLLSSELLKTLFEAYRASGKPLGLPSCQGVLGHPLFLLPAFKSELSRLRAGASHRDLILAHPDDVEVLLTEFTAVLRAIETLSDYREMIRIAALPMPDLRAYRDALALRLEPQVGAGAEASGRPPWSA